MERVAVVSDIHGNLEAWDAVVKDIDARGISRIFCLGDLVGKGPNPVEVTDQVRTRCEVVVRGNWDELVGRQEDDNFSWHAQRLGPERVAYLASLPFQHDVIMSGRRIRLLHASPQSVYHRVQPWDPAEKRLAMFDPLPDEEAVARFEPDIVGYGDVHNAFLQHLRGKTLFNVGSVGNPLDMTQASYCILEGMLGSRENAPFSIQFMRVPYDIELAVAQAEKAGVPSLDYYVRELRTGIYRGLQD
ncbi:metallophosphatase family protein [Paenibacillus sp. P96]|uniref:Metallophosphatase family protein n=1 Tax=Paenibacillus zeirhizosphaerae TaxID=2987519 RepID=A0ABT9FUT1_9BACL|nr:metallophosphoesterase family protein [Paenibacillus sp. P96]MDP4098460.1 metallophosphatase family protein [Paenibacillus sp. P96]